MPVRIEIGPKDLENGSAILVRRDNGVKESCSIDQIPKRTGEVLQDIQSSLFKTALKRRNESNKTADSWQEFEKALKQGGYVFSFFCGEEKCESEIKAKTKAVSRFLPLNAKKEDGDHFCIHCGKKTLHKKRWAFALAY